MNKRTFLISSSAAVLSGCSSVSVNRDYDASFDFKSLKTYAWQHDMQPETGVPRIDNDLNDRRIRNAVDADLASKGFKKVEKNEADFHVAYFMDFQQRIDGSGGSLSFGVGRSSYGRGSSIGYSTGGTISDYEEGQLTIDILNPSDEQTIWRGRGRRRTSSSDNPEKITARVNDAVMRILKKFPPKQK
ncbi:DUF4136 domain-containing protein [Pontiellaceae bacterium B12227]|nr:DUF4136 domain-containing protein [Pontiellaceae bacterium B12227]